MRGKHALYRGRMWLATLGLLAHTSFAEIPGSLTIQGLVWHYPYSTSMAGVPLHGSSFVSNLDPLTLAERFSAFPQFRQVLLLPDGVSLSGIEADRHWLVQIRAASSGSEGDVSVLDFAGESVSAMHMAAELSWLAAHARPLLHQRHPAKIASGNEGRSQYIYMVNMAAGQLGRFMATRLQLDGWLAASVPVSLDSQTWRKGPLELFIHIEPSMKGTLLYVQIQSN